MLGLQLDENEIRLMGYWILITDGGKGLKKLHQRFAIILLICSHSQIFLMIQLMMLLVVWSLKLQRI